MHRPPPPPRPPGPGTPGQALAIARGKLKPHGQRPLAARLGHAVGHSHAKHQRWHRYALEPFWIPAGCRLPGRRRVPDGPCRHPRPISGTGNARVPCIRTAGGNQQESRLSGRAGAGRENSRHCWRLRKDLHLRQNPGHHASLTRRAPAAGSNFQPGCPVRYASARSWAG